MLRRNTILHHIVLPDKFKTIPLFTDFTEGSRRVTLRARQPATAKHTSAVASGLVHILPMSHAGTIRFFDSVIGFIVEETARIGIPDTTQLSPQQQGLAKVLMEGLAENSTERETETREWGTLAQHARDAANAVEVSRAFIADFLARIMEGRLYRPETLEEICSFYRLPYPLPSNLVLQDAYFRPLAAARFPALLTSGDICLCDYPPDRKRELLENPQMMRMERERECASRIRRFIAAGAERVFVPWGHFHCPMIVAQLMIPDSTTSRYTGADLTFDVHDAASESVSYGWSKELLEDIYGEHSAAGK